MNSYILKYQEPLSNRWEIEVVTFGNNMTFIGCVRTYGLLSISEDDEVVKKSIAIFTYSDF